MPSVNHRARVTGEEIVDQTILEIDIGPAAVGFTELTAGLQGSLGVVPDTIGTTQLKEPGVGSQNIYNGAVYGTKIANDAVGSQHIQGTAISYENQVKINILGYGRLTAGLQGSLGGMPDTIGTTQLKEPGVGSENIYSNAIYAAKIAANAVGYGKLTTGLQGSLGGMPDTIGTTQIKKPGVGSENVADNAIYRNAQLGDNVIESTNLRDLYQYGTLSGITATGTYVLFPSEYGTTVTPITVVVTGVGAVVYLAGAPSAGSFKVQRSTAGTSDFSWMSWGRKPGIG